LQSPVFFFAEIIGATNDGQVKISSKRLVLALETLQNSLISARKRDFASVSQFFRLFSYLLYESADSVIECALTT